MPQYDAETPLSPNPEDLYRPEDYPSEPRYDEALHGTDWGELYGGVDPELSGDLTPWRLNDIRIDGFSTASDIPVIQPGESGDYSCVFIPLGEDVPAVTASHIERYRAARTLIERGPRTIVYDDAPRPYYREQHDGPPGSQLVVLAPLHPHRDAVTRDGSAPASRPSVHDPRWAVVTDGEDKTTRPDKQCLLDIETVTLGSLRDYPDRETARAAFERNGYSY